MPSKQQPVVHPGRWGSRRAHPVLVALMMILGMALVLAALTGTAAAFPTSQTAQEGQAIFQEKCAACHTLGGGRLVGPDLQGVTQQRDLQWLKSFMLDPNALFASGDPTAAALLKEYNNVKMPNLGLSEADVQALLAYLENPSNTASQPAAAPAQAAGIAMYGERLFTGQQSFANGGTSCQACHSVNGIGELGGGTLGPDLTQVYTRYGEAGLNAALNSIAFPSMVGIFAKQPITAQERADLVAFFKETSQRPPAPAAYTWIFVAIGVALTLGLFALMLLFWARQRQTISERLRKPGRR